MEALYRVTLREICARTGATRRAVQGYEKAGLVSAVGKNKYGYLLYDEAGEARIKLIRFYQRAGFSLREIAEIIDAPKEAQKAALCAQVEKLSVRKDELQNLIEQVEQYIASL